MSSPFPLRVALGLGDQELEQRLRPALDMDDELVVAMNCLSADQVVRAVEAEAADVIVIAWGLHRLSEAVLGQFETGRLGVVLLAPSHMTRLEGLQRITVLSLDADADTLRTAIKLAARGERWRAPRPRAASTASHGAESESAPRSALQVLTVAGGAGSPGRTTLAINLATALGAVAPTALVDLDCTSPAVAAYLDRDPSRNVCTLAHAVREDPRAWGAALEQELQPLHPRSPSAVVLCGLPKRELRASVTASFVDRLIEELARRYRYLVLDIGAELLGMETPATVHRAALGLAQHTLVATNCDLVGLWHTRTTLAHLERALSIDRARISLVANRHDPRHHHSPSEIEWHLGAAVAAVIPNDHRALQHAVADQAPAVLDRRSRAGRAILQLAERVHAGRVRIAAPEPGSSARRGWRAALPAALASVLRSGSAT
jgi:Flp pilus assembly CpaE family ATPase